jgi:hypothetical protein
MSISSKVLPVRIKPKLDLNRLKIIGDIYGENLLQAVENQKQNND